MPQSCLDPSRLINGIELERGRLAEIPAARVPVMDLPRDKREVACRRLFAGAKSTVVEIACGRRCQRGF